MTHCDELIDDETAPKGLRAFLEWNRRPADKKTGKSPVLFATLTETVAVHENVSQHGPITAMKLDAGTRIRVVMASRFGDVGITSDLTAEHGYMARVDVDMLTDFSEE